jgi:adenylate kinase
MLPCERIVVLRCRPDVLKNRLSSRNYREEKILENFDAEALDVCLIETVEEFKPYQILELDTTDHDIPYCADQIERFVKGDIPSGFGTIDWTAFLEV